MSFQPQTVALGSAPPAATDAPRAGRRGLLRRPLSLVTWGLIAALSLMAVLAPLIAPHDPTVRSGPTLLAPGSPGHLLGTDSFGRDQLSRLIWGARPLIAASIASVLIALVIGSLIGIVAGYAGGWTETGLMRAMDAVLSFPLILLAIMIVAALGPGLPNVIAAIAIAQVPVFARLVQALTVREATKEYVLAARAAGYPAGRIVLREIAPNVAGPVVVQATSVIAVAAGYAAALSYLGLGIQPPTPDWGYMVKEGQEFLFTAWDLAVIPGLLITAFVVACNFAGDDLRDLLDVGRER